MFVWQHYLPRCSLLRIIEILQLNCLSQNFYCMLIVRILPWLRLKGSYSNIKFFLSFWELTLQFELNTSSPAGKLSVDYISFTLCAVCPTPVIIWKNPIIIGRLKQIMPRSQPYDFDYMFSFIWETLLKEINNNKISTLSCNIYS